MTEGELVDAGLQFYLNQGSSSVVQDADQRKKAWFYTTKVAKRLWDSAPYLRARSHTIPGPCPISLRLLPDIRGREAPKTTSNEKYPNVGCLQK